MKKVKNFARFYALLNQMPGQDSQDKEEIKQTLVRSFTNDRTTSLREMEPAEYNAMCDSITHTVKGKHTAKLISSELKEQRSAVLHRLQKLGVNTADWSEVDNYCLQNRIAGKKFYYLTVDELRGLVKKLEAIMRKTKPQKPKEQPEEILLTDKQLQYLIRNMPSQILN